MASFVSWLLAELSLDLYDDGSAAYVCSGLGLETDIRVMSKKLRGGGVIALYVRAPPPSSFSRNFANEVHSRNHPNWPILKIILRPSRDASTGEIPALHHNTGAPTLPRVLVQI